jgi:transcriptional repressor NrdR
VPFDRDKLVRSFEIALRKRRSIPTASNARSRHRPRLESSGETEIQLRQIGLQVLER